MHQWLVNIKQGGAQYCGLRPEYRRIRPLHIYIFDFCITSKKFPRFYPIWICTNSTILKSFLCLVWKINRYDNLCIRFLGLLTNFSHWDLRGKVGGFEATYLVQLSVKETMIGEGEKKVEVGGQLSWNNFATLHPTSSHPFVKGV